MIASAYLAAEGYETQLADELAASGVAVSSWHGRLALSPDPPYGSLWALDVWTTPAEIAVGSVKDAADALRAIQRNWAGYAAGFHRRSALVAARLPPVSARKLVFPQAAPASHLGAWTLLEPGRLLASPAKSSPFPNGEALFEEDHIGPPSRAYLKLWEACTRIGIWPAPNETCLDLGAAPGGWTWALAQLGACVTAIDKAPLAPAVSAMPGVSWRDGSAFALMPEPVDWLFSDVIAYPTRLLGLVQRWIAADAPKHIVCTVKLQSGRDADAVAGFKEIPGGRLMHLFHNKHELTFTWSRQS